MTTLKEKIINIIKRYNNKDCYNDLLISNTAKIELIEKIKKLK